jgi:hypothetical protein
MENMQQGLTTFDTPVELSVEDGKYIIKLKNKTTFIRWDDGYIKAVDIQALLNFVRFVYRAGYSDGSIQALNNPNQPAGNYMLNEISCAGQTNQNVCNTISNSVCLPTEVKTEG